MSSKSSKGGGAPAQEERFPVTVKPFRPERLILCLDICNEMNSTELARGRKVIGSRLDFLRAYLRSFLQIKQKLSPEHEFALCVLTDTAVWLQDFTPDIDAILSQMAHLTGSGTFLQFNMSSLFELILSKISDPAVFQKQEPPSFVYRCIFIYGRSSIIPQFYDGEMSKNRLLQAPYFFFDALYVHEKPSKDNNPQEVYDRITDFDLNNTGYFFESSTNPKRLYFHMAQLLSNPLQRSEESSWKTVLGNPDAD